MYHGLSAVSLCRYSPRMASGMQEKQFTASLLNFFVYNPTFGPREGEVRWIHRYRNAKHMFYTCICLLRLYSGNSTVNSRLNCCLFKEEKKILFYHPSEVEKNEKIRNVGLCEAIVQFTR